MEFRTAIETVPCRRAITHDTPLLMLGSCFTDEVGQRLEMDGFEVCRNPFGPLYNPLSIATPLLRAEKGKYYTTADLVEGPRGWHCLDYASRYSSPEADGLLAQINNALTGLRHFMGRKPVTIITLGSSYVFRLASDGRTVGNCHKFPASDFVHSRLSVDQASKALDGIVRTLRSSGIEKIIFTISPIRHLAYGLHGNQLGKATLLLAVDNVATEGRAEYFPSYEIMLDDLRDYRFYGRDMKHPTDVAVDYIYDNFCHTYMDKATIARALECRKAFKAANHRNLF